MDSLQSGHNWPYLFNILRNFRGKCIQLQIFKKIVRVAGLKTCLSRKIGITTYPMNNPAQLQRITIDCQSTL